jgi:hypothetical protein
MIQIERWENGLIGELTLGNDIVYSGNEENNHTVTSIKIMLIC